MDNKNTWKILNIYRRYGPQLLFTAALYNGSKEYFNIDPSMSDSISKGLIYLNDYIKITKHTEEGIVFELCNEMENESGGGLEGGSGNESIFYTDEKTRKNPPFTQKKPEKYLPFLCDILPYHPSEIGTVAASPIYKNNYFTGKYKIGENEVSNLKTPLPKQFIAKIHQKTRINVCPNDYNPFFFIIVSSNDILLKIVFWRESLKTYSNLKVGDIIYVKDYKTKKRLHSIDVMEYNTFTESQYFDCNEITAKEILKIENNNRGKVKNIFETVEGRVEYLSVLMRYTCNLCIMEYVLCRIGGSEVVLFYNSDDEFWNIKEGKILKVTELRVMERAGYRMYVSTIYSQFEILEDAAGKQRYNINTDASKRSKTISGVFGAIGYLPDGFSKVSEVIDYELTERIGTRDVPTNLFMKPVVIGLSVLSQQSFVLNETRKFVLDVTITSVSESVLKIDYYEDGEVFQQSSRRVLLDGVFEVFLFKNYFLGDEPRVGENVGKRVFLAVEGFRVNVGTVLYYVTGILQGN